MDRKKMIEWRRKGSVERVEGPTKPSRARSLGYKAKQGFIVVRSRIRKGGRTRPAIKKARKPSKSGLIHYTPSQNKQAIAEKRAARKYRNMEVLNSYKCGEDGQYHYFEVIFVDKSHPSIKADKSLEWLQHVNGRVFRGLTSAGRKSRGI